MAIGTSVKVGFDGNEVKKGFGSIGSMFKNIGKGLAIGGGMAAGKTLLDLGLKAATGIDALADFAGEAQDTALQVESTTSEIIKLNRALELAGAGVDASNLLSTMRDNLYDAAHGGEEMQKVIESLGLTMADLQGQSTMEQFNIIGKAVANMGDNVDGLEEKMMKIFGGKMGKKIQRLFKNSEVFDQAGEQMGRFASNVENSADRLGRVQDQYQRIPYLWKALNLAIFDASGSTGAYLKKLFDGIDAALSAGDFGKISYLLKSEFAKALEIFTESGVVEKIKGSFRSIGEAIGEGIGDALKKTLPSFMSLPKWLGGDGGKTAMADPISEIQRTNALLEKIYRDGGALYA